MKYAIFFLLISTTAAAQQMPDYIVYLVKGEVTTHKGTGKPVKVKQHQFIYGPETITVKQGAEVTLSDKSGASFVLNSPKAYAVRSLSKRQIKSTDNLTQKYLHLLYHELLDPGHDYNKFKKENVGGVWGGVNRSGDCGNLLFPVVGTKTADKTVQFKWRNTSRANNYFVKVYNSEAKEVVSLPAKDTFLTIDLAKYIPEAEGKYYWRIQGDETACEDETPLLLELITHEQEDKKVQELEMVGTNKLWVIEQLEKDNFLPRAQKYFQSFVNASNDPSLAKTYTWFLLKYNLDEEAKKSWEGSRQ
ncbi:MAG: hypothetical protein ACXWD4_15320 [Bacteroidia bacterium]